MIEAYTEKDDPYARVILGKIKLSNYQICCLRDDGECPLTSKQMEVMEKFKAIWAIDNSKTDYARETITEVIDKIKRRNKLVKIADSSEGVGRLLGQYESNPVASNSDDESKINKAESRAIRKRNAKGKKSASKKANYSAPSTPSQFVDTFQKKNQPFREPQSWYNGQALYQNQPSTSGYQRQNRQGACYGCGSFQHWRSQCPFNPRPIQPKSK
ncbi:unnamed protein product [Mytilus coruscus]|uniref:CCHC-type domain-containing protein n=1 Tax=Mytilus coruscus TaxID=42192 RepID=A0A6J8BWC9_MYTCO|nr:unnamed protein product [Mytilus coruscus]